MKSLNLNPIEAKVLRSLNLQATDYTGGEFGFMPYVNKCGLSDHQFAGYISALEAKGVFAYNNKTCGSYNGQFAIKPEYSMPEAMKRYIAEVK